MQHKIHSLTAGTLLLLTLSCTPAVQQQDMTIAPSESAAPAALQALQPNLVCMVNDAYMGGKEQLPVPFDGRTYFGCCTMCVSRIQTDRSVRYARDPQTGQEVDKALAFIARAADGHTVYYFESAASFSAFQKRQDKP